jgi:hypothetical protein
MLSVLSVVSVVMARSSRSAVVIAACLAVFLAPIGPESSAALPTPGAGQPASQAVTPATVAALIEDLTPANVAILRRGVVHADPIVRAAAARVAGLSGQPDLASAIAEAFGREQDRLPAAEQARALLFLKGAGAIPDIEPRLAQAGQPAVLVFANWLARMQPDIFVDRLPRFVSSMKDARSLNPMVSIALETQAASRETILRAWFQAASPAAWGAVISGRTFSIRSPAEGAVLIEALRSESSEVREATVWGLVSRLAFTRPVPQPVLDAVSAPEPSPASALSWELFGREVIGRRRSGVKTMDRSAWLATEAARHEYDARILLGLETTTEPERRAIRSALDDRNFARRFGAAGSTAGRNGR